MQWVAVKVAETNIDTAILSVFWQLHSKLLNETATICGCDLARRAASVLCDFLMPPNRHLLAVVLSDNSFCAVYIMKMRIHHRNDWALRHFT